MDWNGYEQQGYGQQMYGQQGYSQMYPQYQQPRYSKQDYLQGMRNFIYANTNMLPIQEIKIEDLPDNWRHACVTQGVVNLPKSIFAVSETGVSIQFYFCTQCGKLFYFGDFM